MVYKSKLCITSLSCGSWRTCWPGSACSATPSPPSTPNATSSATFEAGLTRTYTSQSPLHYFRSPAKMFDTSGELKVAGAALTAKMKSRSLACRLESAAWAQRGNGSAGSFLHWLLGSYLSWDRSRVARLSILGLPSPILFLCPCLYHQCWRP